MTSAVDARGLTVLSELKKLAEARYDQCDRQPVDFQNDGKMQDTPEVPPRKSLRRVAQRITADGSVEPVQHHNRRARPQLKIQVSPPPPNSQERPVSIAVSALRTPKKLKRAVSAAVISSTGERSPTTPTMLTPKGPQPRSVLRRLSKSISMNLAKVFKQQSQETQNSVPLTSLEQPKSKRNSKRPSNGSKAESFPSRSDSVSSRDSSISVMEYLAERRAREEQEVDDSMPVSLEEYGKNCFLYGCEEMHACNPDVGSPSPVVHCGCDPENPSKRHAHITDPPEVQMAIQLKAKRRAERKAAAALQAQKQAPPPPLPPQNTNLANKRRSTQRHVLLPASENENPNKLVVPRPKLSEGPVVIRTGILREASNRLRVVTNNY